MKRVISCILAVTMCFAVTACDGRNLETPVDTSPVQEHLTETVPVETEPETMPTPTFISDNNIIINDTYSNSYCFEQYYDIHIYDAYPSSNGEEIYNGSLDNNFLYEDLVSRPSQYYEREVTVAKHYGEGEGLQELETVAEISVYETPLFLEQQYNDIAYSILRMESENPASAAVSEDVWDEKTASLHGKYSNHKLVSCVLEFDWGAIDNMELFEETGGLYVNIGFEMIDKYSGKAFAPIGVSGFLEDVIEADGHSYEIAIFTSGASIYVDEHLRSAAVISAIVPAEYDGAVFAVGNGWVDDRQEDIAVYNHKDSRLLSGSNTGYYAYQPVVIDNEMLSLLADTLYSKSAVADLQAVTGDLDVDSIEDSFAYAYSGYISIAKNIDGAITVVNGVYGACAVSLFVTDNDYNLLYQTGAIAPGEVLSGVAAGDSVAEAQHYGIVHYNEEGSAILVEFIRLW